MVHLLEAALVLRIADLLPCIIKRLLAECFSMRFPWIGTVEEKRLRQNEPRA